MTISNLFEWVGLLIAVGAAVDTLWPFIFDGRSRYSRSRITRVLQKMFPPIASSGVSSKLFDHLYGNRLLSIRAVTTSILVTIVSIASTFLIAYLPNPAVLADLIDGNGIYNSIVVSSYLMLAISVFVADYLSSVQTRIFVRSLERNRSATVTSVMIVSDFVVSLVIFIVIFSTSRAAIYVVMTTSGSAISTYSFGFSPELIVGVANKLALPEDISVRLAAVPQTADEAVSLSVVRVILDEGEALGMLANLQGYLSAEYPRMPLQGQEGITTEVEVNSCISSEVELPTSLDNYSIIASSHAYLASALARLYSNEEIASILDENKLQAAFEQEAGLRWIQNPGCPFGVIRVKKTMEFTAMLSESSLGDIYLSALAATLDDASKVVPSKFGQFQLLELGREIDAFAFDAVAVFSYGRNGRAPNVFTAGIKGEWRTAERSRLEVPFSILLASSLSASILLWIHLILGRIISLAVWIRARVSVVVNRPKVESIVFTFIATAIASVMCVAYILGGAAQVAWGLFSTAFL